MLEKSMLINSSIVKLKWIKTLYIKTCTKFVIAGGINTFISYIVYLILIHFTTYKIAYTIAFMFGIMISYLLNLLYVFEKKHSLKKIVRYGFIYLFQYVFGFFLLTFLVCFIKINQMIAPILVTISSIPITYLLTQRVLTRE